jgi:hypothetical protein
MNLPLGRNCVIGREKLRERKQLLLKDTTNVNNGFVDDFLCHVNRVSFLH